MNAKASENQNAAQTQTQAKAKTETTGSEQAQTQAQDQQPQPKVQVTQEMLDKLQLSMQQKAKEMQEEKKGFWENLLDNKWYYARYLVEAAGVIGLIGGGVALYNCKSNNAETSAKLDELQDDYNILEHQAQSAGVDTKAAVKAVS